MEDIINHGESYILHNGENMIWYFFLGENKKIGYIIKDGENWSPVNKLDSQPLKGYSVTMDKAGIIRLLAYTETKYLIYYEFSQGRWINRTLERIHSRFQDITYYDIQSSPLGTHIIYYLNHSLSRSSETLVHYYISRGKWQGGPLWRFISDQFTRPLDVHSSAMGKHSIIFSQKAKKKYHLYYAYYDVSSLSWVDPTFIHSKDKNYNYRLFEKSDHSPLILWSHKSDQYYEISLLLSQSAGKGLAWTETLIHSSKDKILNPFLLIDGDVYCFWEELRSIKGSFSKDLLTWSTPRVLTHLAKDDTEFIPHKLLAIRDGIPNTMTYLGAKSSYQNLFGLQEYPIDLVINSSCNESRAGILKEKNIQHKILGDIDKQQILDSIKTDNRKLKRNLENLLEEIDRINNTNYHLREKVELNESALFNINAKLRELDFMLNQLRSRMGKGKLPNIPYTYSTNYKPPEDNDPHKSRENNDKSRESDKNAMLKSAPQKRVTIKTRPIYDHKDHPTDEDNNKANSAAINKNETLNNPKNITPQNIELTKESIDEPKESKESIENVDKIHEEKGMTKNDVENAKKDFKARGSEENQDKEKDIERISLGNTTILINPPDSHDL